MVNQISKYHEDLVKIEEPIEDFQKTDRGYKDIYLTKYKNIDTPKKMALNINASLTRSRVQSMSSIKKKNISEFKTMPSITLQMQMKALKFLKENKYQFNLCSQNL